MDNKIKYFIRESILKIMYFFWILTSHRTKIIIVNLVKTFYHRYKPLLGITEYSNKSSSKDNRISFVIQKKSFVSIIIPTFNHPYELKNCLEAITKNTRYNDYEVILVDNNSFDKKSLEIIKKSGHRVIKYPYKFNFSKINNFATRYAKGEYLLFLNNDTRPIRDWLIPMLNECQKEDTGIVGNKLLYNDNSIQHAGIDFDIKSLRFFHSYRYNSAFSKEVNRIKEVPAVTGACLMIKKNLFEQVGGFDEDYWTDLQDVELCFSIRRLGFKVIYTPYSIVYHREGATRGLVPEETSLC